MLGKMLLAVRLRRNEQKPLRYSSLAGVGRFARCRNRSHPVARNGGSRCEKWVVVIVGEGVRQTTLPFLNFAEVWIEGFVPIDHLEACSAPFWRNRFFR